MKTQLKTFVKSFKLNMNYFYIVIYDLLFHLIFLPILFLAQYISNTYTESMDIPSMEQIALTPEITQFAATEARNLIIMIIAIVLLIIIIALVSWSFSRGLIYTTLLKKKLTKGYFIRFIGLNLIIGIAAFIFILSSSPIIVQSRTLISIFYLLILIAAYFITLIYITFTKKQKIFESIGTALSVGIIKFPKLILPCLLIFIVFVIIGIISSLIPVQILQLLIFTMFFAWARIYFVPIAEKLI